MQRKTHVRQSLVAVWTLMVEAFVYSGGKVFVLMNVHCAKPLDALLAQILFPLNRGTDGKSAY
jgi:hypothetical protein